MRLHKLSMENFRPYDGKCEIDLSPAEGNQLVLIFGENMMGKTGIFLALNWCLYGRALGRQNEQIPIYAPGSLENNYLINANAIERAEYRMRVEIDFKHEGKDWRLTRTATCAGDPTAGDQFVAEPSLQIDDGVRPKQEINEQINRVLHHEAAQFYLFDGELLSQYERWLEEPEQRETKVRQAVERTVGTAALRLYNELEEVAKDEEDEQRRLVKREQKEEKLATDLEEKRKTVDALNGEIAEYEAAIAEFEDEVKKIEKTSGELADFAQEQGRLQEIEKAIDSARERQTRAEDSLRQLVHSTYWLPLLPAADRLHGTLTAALEDAISGPQEAVRLDMLNRSLEAGACDLCERKLDGPSRGLMSGNQQDLTLASIHKVGVEEVADLVQRSKECDLFRGESVVELLGEYEDARLDAKSEIHKLENEAKAIRDEHSDRPRGDREREMGRLRDIHDRIGDTRESKAEAEHSREQVNAEIRSLQTRINRIEIDPKIQRRARAARVSVDAFQGALNSFREEARKRVERKASAIFRDLVDDPDYAALQIDEDYRVVPVDEAEVVLPIPSAGGQQLVTLALIGGLNASAVHDAPIIMDTPAGRIDKPNRKRILEWVRGLDQQVVLMVHSGEFTPLEVEEMGVEVGRSYRIQKVGARSSEIVPANWEV